MQIIIRKVPLGASIHCVDQGLSGRRVFQYDRLLSTTGAGGHGLEATELTIELLLLYYSAVVLANEALEVVTIDWTIGAHGCFDCYNIILFINIT